MSHLRPIDRWFIAEILPLEPLLLASARRLVEDPDAARDLVQDAFAKLLSMDGYCSTLATLERIYGAIKDGFGFHDVRRATGLMQRAH